MAVPAKDTIYIDIDDEITGIIDKIRASDGKVLALVLPKRAAVMQSVVNMKLLKRAADDVKKHVVLITTEAGLLPLAGMVGMHVAKSLTSKPEIPGAPAMNEEEETVNEVADMGDNDFDPNTEANKTVGVLAGLPPSDEVETVEMGDELPVPSTAAVDAADAAELADNGKGKKAKKPKKDKSLIVPNFKRFRLFLVLGVLIIILLIGGAVFAEKALPKATINITTDATNVNANMNLVLSTTADSLDSSSNTVPATQVQQQKTYTEQVATTGQKNDGQSASGSVTFTDCTSDGSSVDIPAGSGVTANGQTYITQSDVYLQGSLFKGKSGACQSLPGTAGTTNVTAQSPGTSSNLASGSDMTVVGDSDVNAVSSSAISGGTDNIVQTVSQTDINTAKSKVSTSDPTVKQSLENELDGKSLYPITATYSPGTPVVSSDQAVGAVANNVTVTEVITYTMLGVAKSDLQTLVDSSVNGQINTSKQSILDDGIDNATFSITNTTSTGAQISMQDTATAGPELNISQIQQEAAGKKSADLTSELESNPDVTNVQVNLSPFFVNSIPSNTNKITVNIAKPTKTVNSGSSSNAGN
jgi:hypothetical protein